MVGLLTFLWFGGLIGCVGCTCGFWFGFGCLFPVLVGCVVW